MGLTLFEKIKQSTIVGNMLTLSIGSIISQIVPVLMSLVLARIYSPAEYGDWGIFSSYATIIAIFVCGRYEYAILRPKRKVDALNLMYLSALICIGCVFVLFICYCIGRVLGVFSSFSVLYVLLLCCYMIALGGAQILQNYLNREESYKRIAVGSIWRSCTQAIFRFVLGIIHFPFNGLILGPIIGTWVNVIYWKNGISFLRDIKRSFSMRNIIRQFKKYHKFPCYDLPSSLLNTLSTNLPLILLAYFFGKSDVGYFSMAISLLYIPISFLGTAQGQIFYKKSCSWENKEQIAILAWRIFKINFVIGAFSLLVLFSFEKVLFVFLLSDIWSTVGKFAVYLSLWIWGVLCFTPLSTIFLSKDKQKISVILNMSMFVMRLLAVWIGGSILHSMEYTIIMYGIIGFILWIIEGYIIFRLINIHVQIKDFWFIGVVLIFILLIWGWKVSLIFV